MFYNDPAIDDVEWYGTFQIAINRRPTVSSMGADTIKVPDGTVWTFGSSLASDPENLPLTKTLIVDGSTSPPPWLVYDLATFEFRVVTSSNSIAGLHNITVDVDDTFTIPVSTTFMLIIEENVAPVRRKSINGISIVNHQVQTHH